MMNLIGQVLIEAIVVGISTVLMGTVVSFVISQIVPSYGTSGSNDSKDWNKYYVMEIALFFTGFFLHIAYEILGLNSWYCKEIFAKSRK
jgi:hypothetical protein